MVKIDVRRNSILQLLAAIFYQPFVLANSTRDFQRGLEFVSEHFNPSFQCSFLLIDISFGLTTSCFLGRNGSMSGDADSLDDFMSSLGTSLDKTTRTQIRRKIFDLKKVNLVITLNLPY